MWHNTGVISSFGVGRQDDVQHAKMGSTAQCAHDFTFYFSYDMIRRIETSHEISDIAKSPEMYSKRCYVQRCRSDGFQLVLCDMGLIPFIQQSMHDC